MAKQMKTYQKFKMVKWYLNGEKKMHEIIQYIRENDLSNTKTVYLKARIKIWIDKFLENGIDGLISQTGKSPKKNKGSGRPRKIPDWKDMDKDMLIKILEILNEDWEEEITKIRKDNKFSSIEKMNVNFGFTLTSLCILFKVSKSGFYKWKSKHDVLKKDVHHINNNDLLNEIKKIHFQNRKVYGCRKIAEKLKEKGYFLSKTSVNRIMNKNFIKCLIRVKKRNKRIDPKNINVNIENVINREFQSNNFNHKIFGDITFIPYRGNFIYLSAYIETFSNKLIGWSLSKSPDTDLVLNSIKNINFEKNSIVHTDRGIQYSSQKYMNFLSQNNITQSMSKIANSLDNRPIEYWFSILKSEWLSQINIDKMSLEEINDSIRKYINFYNFSRIQTVLKNMSPVNFLETYL